MALLNAVHHFKFGRLYAFHRSNSTEHGVSDPGRAVNREVQRDQAVDHGLDLFFLGALMHDYQHRRAPLIG